jgi:hypothetical protein
VPVAFGKMQLNDFTELNIETKFCRASPVKYLLYDLFIAALCPIFYLTD